MVEPIFVCFALVAAAGLVAGPAYRRQAQCRADLIELLSANGVVCTDWGALSPCTAQFAARAYLVVDARTADTAPARTQRMLRSALRLSEESGLALMVVAPHGTSLPGGTFHVVPDAGVPKVEPRQPSLTNPVAGKGSGITLGATSSLRCAA